MKEMYILYFSLVHYLHYKKVLFTVVLSEVINNIFMLFTTTAVMHCSKIQNNPPTSQATRPRCMVRKEAGSSHA